MEMLSCTSSSPAILEDALGARGGKDGWEGDKDREEVCELETGTCHLPLHGLEHEPPKGAQGGGQG